MNLIEYFTKVREQTVSFCSHLNIEDYSIQVVAFASPPKWHLAHTTWFFEEFILKSFLPNYKVFNTSFNFLFNSYYNNLGTRILQANRGNMSRPVTSKILEYRNYVDAYMIELLKQNSTKELADLIILGLNHEQQHQELLVTDVKYMFGHNPIFPVYQKEFNLLKDKNQYQDRIKFKEGIYIIGYKGKDFCYDNELGLHKVFVDDFEMNNHLVTNGDYLEFMESGGYSDFNLWLDEGWTWVNKNKVKAPLYWYNIDNTWHYYTLAGLQPVDKDAILSHINFYEANAFAEWKGMRLPTEFEWEIASNQIDWGKRWEWTASAYLPYPNFEKANGAVGEYNGKFMSNKMVLRGASVATSKNHSRNTYRNFFNPLERWQYTGIRLVK
ncbi:ergothioneine biosynthesis protein EgtB [Winogradskyella litoriviva]|uniref:Ergothioneine biosynthesis protein EgtB n=1 Tax=Winogradskyella litoriviva TaxID=1220182 RepID=A0ABX2E7H2_9FLAO|nr:ergothioneine biosynthesis protein EgtB [Winogradskyella litoriviva]NRD23651.1 ergothioneine biosynthesis protein EgtB [Winogradskyella litoriviva]